LAADEHGVEPDDVGRLHCRIVGGPGSAFGEMGADNLRISYANSQASLEDALDRIRDFLDAAR
jgi:bifunctional pyridoxal-dependent enzyme with beta-cystathionase and maltose regulon repressor activities